MESSEGRHRRKAVKVGVVIGGGPPPGYQWNGKVLDCAHAESLSLFTEVQRDHLNEQFREACREVEPTTCATLDIRPIGGFYELRDKGGVLGNNNARVFFFLDKAARTIVVIGAIKKQNNGKTPNWEVVRMRRRMRLYPQQQTIGSG
jgi:hypothetical protein